MSGWGVVPKEQANDDEGFSAVSSSSSRLYVVRDELHWRVDGTSMNASTWEGAAAEGDSEKYHKQLEYSGRKDEIKKRIRHGSS